MVDMTKLRKGRGLGAPPPMNEASPNLSAPETAPAPPHPSVAKPVAAPQSPAQPISRKDGRSLRKTNRTVAFATRVTQ